MLGLPAGRNGQPYCFPDDLTDKAVERLHPSRCSAAGRLTRMAGGPAPAPQGALVVYDPERDDVWELS